MDKGFFADGFGLTSNPAQIQRLNGPGPFPPHGDDLAPWLHSDSVLAVRGACCFDLGALRCDRLSFRGFGGVRRCPLLLASLLLSWLLLLRLVLVARGLGQRVGAQLGIAGLAGFVVFVAIVRVEVVAAVLECAPVHFLVFVLLAGIHSYQIAHLAAGVVPLPLRVVKELVESAAAVGVSLGVVAGVDGDVMDVGALEEV